MAGWLVDPFIVSLQSIDLMLILYNQTKYTETNCYLFSDEGTIFTNVYSCIFLWEQINIEMGQLMADAYTS